MARNGINVRRGVPLMAHIRSAAVDLKVSEMADVPNFLVSAFLPLDILVP